MQSHQPDYDPRHNPHKIHRGLKRVLMAAGHSMAGLRYAVEEESAFRQELLLGALMMPWAFILDFTRIEQILLLSSIFFVLIMELLNSGIEATVDRISFQNHSLSKRAKDYGSAAVLLSLILCSAIWITLLLPRLY